jgi:succinate dehydrogenase hydrophobic anchor subunit
MMAAGNPEDETTAPGFAADRSSARGSRSWRATALSGVAVLVLVTVHMVAHHFVVEEIGGLRTYDQVLEYIRSPVIFVLEAVFLVVVTWHAMLGLRAVLFNLELSTTMRTTVTRGVTVLGALTVAYGLVLLTVLAARA